MARIVKPENDNMEEAAELIRNGGLVSFPTETGMFKTLSKNMQEICSGTTCNIKFNFFIIIIKKQI